MTQVPDPIERYARTLAITPEVEDIAWAPLARPLSRCRLALRAIEAEGIPTVSISLYRQIAAKLRLSRALHLRFPFGFPLGRDPQSQRRIILDALGALSTITQPATIIDLPSVWEG